MKTAIERHLKDHILPNNLIFEIMRFFANFKAHHLVNVLGNNFLCHFDKKYVNEVTRVRWAL